MEQPILTFIVRSIQIDHNLVDPFLVFHRQILRWKVKQAETELHLRQKHLKNTAEAQKMVLPGQQVQVQE